MLKITKELTMASTLEQVLDWTENVAEENTHISFKMAKIALIPQGWDSWGQTWQVPAPVSKDADGKIIWTDELHDFVNEINMAGFALHPKEDLID